MIRTLIVFDADLHSGVPGIMAGSYARNLQRGKGHLLSGPRTGIGSFASEFDEQSWG
jgi:hypothetical protein